METYGLEALGIINPSAVYRNLSPVQLVEKALARGEGQLNSTGALCVNTGKYTGRSPNDKFIVDSAGVHDDIAWGKVNVPTTQEVFDALYEKMVAYLQNREIFIFDGFAGADQLMDEEGWWMEQAQYDYYQYNDEGPNVQQFYYGKNAQALYEAVKEDFMAGRIGVRRLSDKNPFYGRDYERDICFTAVNGRNNSTNVRIFVQDTATSTLAALEELEQG